MNLVAFFLTIIAGPVAFALWSRVVYRNRETYRWPIGFVDSIGDGVVLPAFNGFAFAAGLAFTLERLAFAALGSIFVALVYYRIARSTPPNWSKNDDSRLNAGGWYHLVFLTGQSGLIIYALLTHPTLFVLWLMLFAFALMLIYYFAVQLPRRIRV
jgi:hypothetical protein